MNISDTNAIARAEADSGLRLAGFQRLLGVGLTFLPARHHRVLLDHCAYYLKEIYATSAFLIILKRHQPDMEDAVAAFTQC